MTPNDVEVLLHSYVSNRPHPRDAAPAVASAIEEFCAIGAIEKDTRVGGRSFRVTDKGRKWVEMICNTPEPENRWVDPREEP